MDSGNLAVAAGDGMSENARRIGLNALATLPLWLAIGAVVMVARDLSEIASAAIAVALLVTIAGIAAISVVIKKSANTSDQHEVVVRQSLAMIECMKEINRRVMTIEAKHNGVPAAVAMSADMQAPEAVNDQIVAEAPAAPQVKPEIVTPAPVTLPVAPAPIVDRLPANIVELIQPTVQAPAPQPWLEQLYGLANQNVSAVMIHPGDASHRGIRAALDEMGLQLARSSEPVELVVSEIDIDAALTTLHSMLERVPDGAVNIMVGVDQQALKSGGQGRALALARLACLGVRLSLHNVAERLASPETLAASNVARMHINGGWLLLEIARQPLATAQWLGSLGNNGVSLVATDIETVEVARALGGLGIRLGCGNVLTRDAIPSAAKLRQHG